jgi:transcriptional regulator with XRE-family HTH domain
MTSSVDAVVGERIARARRRRGWYQKDLAARIGMSESWVSQVERGVLTIDSLQTAEKIAALAAIGEAEAACRDAGEALETVARVHHAETLRRITSVARTVRGHQSPAARAFQEHLMDVRASLPTMTGTRKDTGL